MKELKTQKNNRSAEEFIEHIADVQVKQDCIKLIDMMQKSTGDSPSMWGESIIGFGSCSYKYATGRSGEWFQVGFSPRKHNLTLYLMHGIERFSEKLARFGKYRNGKACLYIRRLSDVDLEVLQEIIDETVLATAK